MTTTSLLFTLLITPSSLLLSPLLYSLLRHPHHLPTLQSLSPAASRLDNILSSSPSPHSHHLSSTYPPHHPSPPSSPHSSSPHSPSPPLPLQVGGIKPGCFKIGNTGGMLDNILSSKLYRPGSVAYVSRSGGMSNELNNIISMNTNGVYEGVAIGGDRYPGMYCITDAVQRCTCVECARSRNDYFPIIKCLFLPFYSIFYTSTHTTMTMLVLCRFTNCIR